MKLIRYIGEEPLKLGRFETVQPGQILECTVHEAMTALTKPDRFEDAGDTDEEDTKVDRNGDEGPLPFIDNQYFDLATIHWDHKYPAAVLRKKRTLQLNKMAAAIEATTGLHVIYGKGVTKLELIDTILTAAEKAGWCEAR